MAKSSLNAFIFRSGQLPTEVYYWEVSTEDPGHTQEEFQQHSHNFYEILFVCSGNPQYRIGTERYRLQPGDLVFIPPGTSHIPLFSEQDAETYRRYVMWLSEQFVDRLSPVFPDGGFRKYGLLRTQDSSWHFIEHCFQKGITECDQKKVGWTAMLYAHTVELMTHLYRAFLDSHSIQPPSEQPQLLDQILDYVEAHLSEKITLADTARQFYVSESSISTLFRRKIGISFYRCVTQRRLISAKHLILNGGALDEVARQVGFRDYSSFYRAFKNEYGISPRQLRSQKE